MELFAIVVNIFSIGLNNMNLFNISLSNLLLNVKTKGYSTVLLDPTQVESKKSSQIQWPVPSINAEPVDIFLGEE